MYKIVELILFSGLDNDVNTGSTNPPPVTPDHIHLSINRSGLHNLLSLGPHPVVVYNKNTARTCDL